MNSISFKSSFDVLGLDSETTEGLKRRVELMNKARDLIKEAGGVLVRDEAGKFSSTFKVPSTHYDLLMDQLDDLVLEEIVKFRKHSEEVEVCIDNL